MPSITPMSQHTDFIWLLTGLCLKNDRQKTVQEILVFLNSIRSFSIKPASEIPKR
jgi:hypothetical protein